MLIAAAAIDVVMLEEHGGRQDDVGQLRRVGHELLVHAGEEVLAAKSLDHQPLLGCDIGGVGVLDEQRRHRRAAVERRGIAGEDRADARLVEVADARIDEAAAFEQALVELEDARIGVEGATALISPGPGDGRDGKCCMHGDGAVALPGEAVAEAEEGPLRRAHQPGEGLDLVDGKAGDGGRPFRRPRAQMRLQPGRIVGVPLHIGAVGMTVAKQPHA